MLANLEMNITGSRYANDILPYIYDLFWAVQKLWPGELTEGYEEEWNILQQDPAHFYKIRERFNKEHLTCDFLFLCRTSHNGLVRFNGKGHFNAPIAHNADGRTRGIRPHHLEKIISAWRERIVGVWFFSFDYKHFLNELEFTRVGDTIQRYNQRPEKGDFVYCDPPYPSASPVYSTASFSVIELANELEALNRRGVNWMCSYAGSGDPSLEQVSKHKTLLKSGQSSFRKLNGDGKNQVSEMLYWNYVQD